MYTDNSQERFIALYLESQPSIRQLLRLLLRDRRLVEDAAQAVAMRLWELFASYDASRPFEGWARGVAARVVLELKRSECRRWTTLAPETVTAIADGFERNDLATAPPSDQLEALEVCLRTLPVHSRELIVKRYHQALPLDELASQMGRSVEAVQKALYRTMRLLSECVRTRAGLSSANVRS